jgi:O-antigen ligase
MSTLSELDLHDLKVVDKISSGRLSLWDSATRMSLDHWFNGVGPRGFRYGYNKYRPADDKYFSIYSHGSTHPHFALLEIFLETGIIGLISIIVAICLLFYNLRIVPMPTRSAMFAWSLCVFIAIVPNIGKAFYSSYWLTLILYCIFMSVSHLNTKSEQ